MLIVLNFRINNKSFNFLLVLRTLVHNRALERGEVKTGRNILNGLFVRIFALCACIMRVCRVESIIVDSVDAPVAQPG